MTDDGVSDSNSSNPFGHFQVMLVNYLTILTICQKRQKHQVFIPPSIYDLYTRTPQRLITGKLVFLDVF